jgi:hypothetical protein
MKFFYSILFVLFLTAGFSQENQPTFLNNNSSPKDFNSFKERIYFGGNVGAWFGRVTFINVSPLVGIKVTKKFSAGMGVTYNYYSEVYGTRKYVSTIYGGSVFARYLILENLFAQVGIDRLSVPDFRTGLLNSRTWVDNVLIGGGYRQQFSERGSFLMIIFYNLNETPLSPYTNPIVQMGFNVGF